jgi:predicted NBD/HSP70 family sugar kinase
VAATLVNILNPELVIVGGDLASAGPVLVDPLRTAIERYGIATSTEAVRVTAGTLGDRAEILGATALVLSESPHKLVQRVAD